ncbi:hypothetical protein [Pseudomonas putida]|uniref:DUF262 domain-containing protein n=1 Tax=Pseudomonas putida (strain DOT-T1E) TaxID=1196325 RepID=I7BSK6_PSEPT|nr:hypothetical protein [Pseudomonas putida]AFO47102.1 hypothetical protein T1E_1245 [Pseudomonas putida DOT-T1E]UZM91543.1 hypothetical protein OPZ46_16740 [Pseudomonas putida DOT-T1E]
MNIEIFGKPIKDKVLNAYYFVGFTNYKYAITKLFPLVQRLSIQRGSQTPSFYARLRDDLKIGCVLPPITLAFILDTDKTTPNTKYINDEIENGFVLDGIQRLNALYRAHSELDDEAKKAFEERVLHLNIIIAPSMDRLLYRMITLNNGQKPMSPRHQIDILSETIFDFDNLSLRNQSHKTKQVSTDRLAAHRSDIVKGYIAFLANTHAIDNKLVIEEKMDELIAEKIISSEISNDKFEFIEILTWAAEKSNDLKINKWLTVGNNFIGLCAAARKNFNFIRTKGTEEFLDAIEKFEDTFSSFDKKKIKVGEYRRKLVAEYFSNLQKFEAMDKSDVIIELSQ